MVPALERLVSGDEPGPQSSAAARMQNPHGGLSQRARKLPRTCLTAIPSEAKEEALCYGLLLMAWTRHPEAWAWLAGRAKMDRMGGMDIH